MSLDSYLMVCGIGRFVACSYEQVKLILSKLNEVANSQGWISLQGILDIVNDAIPEMEMKARGIAPWYLDKVGYSFKDEQTQPFQLTTATYNGLCIYGIYPTKEG